MFPEGYGWFFNRDDCTFRGTREGGPAVGYQESIEYLESVFKEHGPFDGILGFSQGACLASLLCYLRVKGCKLRYSFSLIFCLRFKVDAHLHISDEGKYFFTLFFKCDSAH